MFRGSLFLLIMVRSKFSNTDFNLIKIILSVLMIGACTISLVQAQTHKIDSLRKNVANAANSLQKVDALLQLCEEFQSMQIDTLFHYASQLKQMTNAETDQHQKIMADVFMNEWLARKNLFDSALRICNEDAKKINYLTNPGSYARMSMQKCYLLMRTNKRQEALSYAYHFLTESESRQDTLSQIYCKYIIGAVYRSMQQTESALQWFNQAENTGINKEFNEKKNDFGVYLQIGGMYNWRAVADSTQQDITADSGKSIYYLDQAITYSRRFENIAVLARALCMKADALEDPGHLSLADNYLKEAIHLYDQLHDTLSILNGITAMSDYYLSSGQAEKGIKACLQGIEIVKRGFNYPLAELYWTLAQCYKNAGNYKSYGETLTSLINLNNVTYKKNSEQDLAELNAKYELSKKEAFIAKQKLEILHKNIWDGFAILFILIIAAATYILFRANRARQKKALRDAEEKERKRIAADLHDNIGAYASAISAGIDEIESKGLIEDSSSVHNLKSNATEIITSLRDTIWAFNKESISLTGISDRVKTYTQKIQPAYPQVFIGVEEDIAKEKKLSPVQALHVFRIIQEALQNALRHSNSNRILIVISSNDESTAISIEDNGIGFVADAALYAGNGLNNMKSRAAESGFQLSFEKISPGGTKIALFRKNEQTKNNKN